MSHYARSIGLLISLAGIAMALSACGARSVAPIAGQVATAIVPTQTISPPTEAPTLLPTATPEPTTVASCAGQWTQAYGAGSPDIEARIQQTLAAEQIDASVRSSTYGENDGCGAFHAASLDIEVTAQAKTITEHGQLEALVREIDAVVQQVHEQIKVAPNIGRRQIIFEANGTTCRWDAEQRVCQPIN
jgi:hypothetical protein